MKLPRLRRKPAPETAEPASASQVAAVLQVLIYSNTDLPEQEFSAQTDKIGRVASYDRDSRSWYTWIPLARPERAAEILSALFEAARVYGTTVQVQPSPQARAAHPARHHDRCRRLTATARLLPQVWPGGRSP